MLEPSSPGVQRFLDYLKNCLEMEEKFRHSWYFFSLNKLAETFFPPGVGINLYNILLYYLKTLVTTSSSHSVNPPQSAWNVERKFKQNKGFPTE